MARVVTRLQQAQAIKSRRPAAVIASNALKELEALAAHMPDIPDADARKLALRMYYLELSEGVSLKDAQTKVGKRFFITPMHCWQSQLLIGSSVWGFFSSSAAPILVATAFSYEVAAQR